MQHFEGYNTSVTNTSKGPEVKKYVRNKNLPSGKHSQTERDNKKLWTTYYFDPVTNEIRTHVKHDRSKHKPYGSVMHIKNSQSENLNMDTSKKVLKKKSTNNKKPTFMVTDLNLENDRHLKVSNDKIKEKIISLRQQHVENHNKFKFYHPTYYNEIDQSIKENISCHRTPSAMSRSFQTTMNKLKFVKESPNQVKKTNSVYERGSQENCAFENLKFDLSPNSTNQMKFSENSDLVSNPNYDNHKGYRSATRNVKRNTIQPQSTDNRKDVLSKQLDKLDTSLKKREKSQKQERKKVVLSRQKFSLNLVNNFISSERQKHRLSLVNRKKLEESSEKNQNKPKSTYKRIKKHSTNIQNVSDSESDSEYEHTFFEKKLKPEILSTVTESTPHNIFINIGDTYNISIEKDSEIFQKYPAKSNLAMNPRVFMQSTLQSKYDSQYIINPRANNVNEKNLFDLQDNITNVEKNFELGQAKSLIPSKQQDFLKFFKNLDEKDKIKQIILHKDKFKRIMKNNSTKKFQEKNYGIDLSKINFNENFSKSCRDNLEYQNDFRSIEITKTPKLSMTELAKLGRNDVLESKSRDDSNRMQTVKSVNVIPSMVKVDNNEVKFRKTDNIWNSKPNDKYYKVNKKKKNGQNHENPKGQHQISPWKKESSENSFEF